MASPSLFDLPCTLLLIVLCHGDWATRKNVDRLVTSLNLGRLSDPFDRQTQHKICNKVTGHKCFTRRDDILRKYGQHLV